MELKQLGETLNGLYNKAKRGQQVVKIHLFGIKYSEQILQYGIKEVVKASGIPSTYVAEVNKGINLAEWVTINKDIEL